MSHVLNKNNLLHDCYICSNTSMKEGVIKNEKQVFFNQIRGEICEINVEDQFSNVVLSLGHENIRHASFVTKTELFNAYKDTIALGDKVTIRFYISS